MRAWAIPKPVPSKPTFMALSAVCLGSGGPVTGIMAQAPDNHARHGFGPGEQLVTSWHPGSPLRRQGPGLNWLFTGW